MCNIVAFNALLNELNTTSKYIVTNNLNNAYFNNATNTICTYILSNNLNHLHLMPYLMNEIL